MYGGNKRQRSDARMDQGPGPHFQGGAMGGMGYDRPQGMGPMQPHGMGMQGMGPGPAMPMSGHGDMGMSAGGGPRFMEQPFLAVKLRGLPFRISEDDIRVFLSCEPVDILMVQRNGRFSGEAYVVLGNMYQLEYALNRNRAHLGQRYVEVFKAKKLDYYKAVTHFMMDGGAIDTGARQYDGGRRFEGGYSHEGGSSRGMSPGLRQEAVHPDAATQQHLPEQSGGPAGRPASGGQHMRPLPDHSGAEHTGVLRLRGLPFSATKEDIRSFFGDLPLTPLLEDGIHIVIANDGRPSGLAFVEFATPEDSAAAMTKDRQMLGNRYVELFPSSRDEATKTATGHLG